MKTKGRPPGAQNKERKASQPEFHETSTRREPSRLEYEEAAEARQDEINGVEPQKSLKGDSEHKVGECEADKDGMKGGERELESREERRGVEERQECRRCG